MKLFCFIFVHAALLIEITLPTKIKPSLCGEPHSADGYTEPVQWRCNGELPLWSYNPALNDCVEFRFGGCGGNENSFSTKDLCLSTCKS